MMTDEKYQNFAYNKAESIIALTGEYFGVAKELTRVPVKNKHFEARDFAIYFAHTLLNKKRVFGYKDLQVLFKLKNHASISLSLNKKKTEFLHIKNEKQKHDELMAFLKKKDPFLFYNEEYAKKVNENKRRSKIRNVEIILTYRDGETLQTEIEWQEQKDIIFNMLKRNEIDY